MPCDEKQFFSLAYGFKSEVERQLSRKLKSTFRGFEFQVSDD